MFFKGQLYIDEVQRGVGIGSIKGCILAGSSQNWVCWDGECLPGNKEEIDSVLLPIRNSPRQYPNEMLEDKMFSSKSKEKYCFSGTENNGISCHIETRKELTYKVA